jgi:phage terminase large subunit
MKASELFVKNSTAPGKVVVNRGGTRSSKTYTIVQLALVWLIGGPIGTITALVGYWSIVRKALPSLKASAYRDFIEELHKLPFSIQQRIRHDKTNLIFSYEGRHIEFFSIDDEQKVRSRKRAVLHCVEANEIDFATFTQLAIRTTHKIFIDFNPDDEFIWIRSELEEKRKAVKKDVSIIVTTYKDNPFLSKQEIDEIEYLAKVDPQLWQVYGLGQYGKTQGLIFPNYETVTTIPEGGYTFLGLDFGFTHDPTAAIEVTKINNNLYLNQKVFARGLTNTDIAEIIKPYNLLTIADSAEPKSIEEIQRQGIRIKGAVKGPDSIRAGINKMKEFNIFITEQSTELLKEFRNYKWHPHKPNQPLDLYNHGIDAVRYVVQTEFRTARQAIKASAVI